MNGHSLTSIAEPSHPDPRTAFQLVKAVQQLSLARDLVRVMEIVRHAARDLTGADGATFILRDGIECFYADEDAIAPLWKGRRFPMECCVSGWVMLHRTAVAIEDIYADDRVLQEAYRPTFVQSLAMVPIRQDSPIGAIGNYWATRHRATPAEMELLQALADSASIAVENVQVYGELEKRVKERTNELAQANEDLEAFSSTAAHDLRAPVRTICGFTDLLIKEGDCNPHALDFACRIQRAADRLSRIIDDTLKLARVSRATLQRSIVDFTALSESIAAELRATEPDRSVEMRITPGLAVTADEGLLRLALTNVLSNAWKFTKQTPHARISVGAEKHGDAQEFFVRDNGAGFDSAKATRLFEPFQRLHADSEFTGTGLGLATVSRIVSKHGGRIRAESSPGAGTTIYFTLG